ncbi:Nucleolar protein 58 [Armadillidium vulgare]|nr:Nucleolar protein 58 [Armadillidium vulgare]
MILDKELNNYIMRAREWYGWHFPELSKIITDNIAYVKSVMLMGMRDKACETDFSTILPEELEEKVKEAAEISMGTEITEEDLLNISFLCQQIIDLSEYRAQLYEYLTIRMQAIAPNLTIMVGELVGARLISHAGSLINLAKNPASTIQILGAEKALFRALKSRKSTPKYGLIYHAHLVGQSSTKNKGKMSRMLAAKAALACRFDAFGEETSSEMGIENKAKLTSRLKVLESGYSRRISGRGKSMAHFDKFDQKNGNVSEYYAAADSTLPSSSKRKFDDSFEGPKAKKIKMEVDESKIKSEPAKIENEPSPKKKKKKKKDVKEEEAEEPEEPVVKKEKKKKRKSQNFDD